MSSVKTYYLADEDNQRKTFGISRMQDIYEKHAGKAHPPHRHNYYTVLVVRKAEGEHIIDFSSFPFEQHQLFFVAPGQVHQVTETGRPEGFALTFSTSFLVEHGIPLHFIEELHLFENYGYSPPLQLGEKDFNRCWEYAEEIYRLFTGNHPLAMESISAFLKLLLISSYNLCDQNDLQLTSLTRKQSLLRDFRQAVEKHYKEQHSSSFYASELVISPDHLNRTVKSQLGKTAKEFIQARLSVEAKRLMHFTDFSIKEVGYELGFNEPANFSAFFKKCTGMTPQEFKKIAA